MRIEAVSFPAKCPFGFTGLLDSFLRRVAKEDDWTGQFIGQLFGPVNEER